MNKKIVGKKYVRISNDGTANCHALLLPSAQLDSPVANPRPHPLRQCADETPTFRPSGRIVHVPLGCAQKAITNKVELLMIMATPLID
jgi:hypothetical protein